MMQVSSKLRSIEGEGYSHWCPACLQMHIFTSGWSFDGNLECPTFNPSMRISGVKTIKVKGEWTGEWERDAGGNPIPFTCHYFLHSGKIQYLSDCTHEMAGQTVDLPDLPEWLKDA